MRSKWQHENDPTWLSDVEAQVATIVQKLLFANNTISAHISVDQIRRFKTLYSSIGLHCRYSSCQHRCVTYGSETELRKHELTHVRSYKCLECDFSERPFASIQDLQKHQAKYHRTSVDLSIPLQIRSLATKSLPPLRRKTQRLGIRGSDVGLSAIDQTSPDDLRPTISNARIDAQQNLQTTREYAAKQKDLNLTDIPERIELETLNSADSVSTPCAESGIEHRLESTDNLKAVLSPKNLDFMSEAGFAIGEAIQTAPETSHESLLRINSIGESRHEPKTSNKNPSKDINVVLENSTERIPSVEDGQSEVESVESRVSRCVQLAAKVHLENHGLYGKGEFSCDRHFCWSALIDSYIDATFANENTITGISEGDSERRLVRVICGLGPDCYRVFLELQTRFLPQEMIRFERAMKLDGENRMGLPAFLEMFRMWGPRHLKDYVKESMSITYACLDIDENDVNDWLYNYIRSHLYDERYLHRYSDWYRIGNLGGIGNRIRKERRVAHCELWIHIRHLIDNHRGPIVYDRVDVNLDVLIRYILSLLCKERRPTEMVTSLKVHLKPSK